MNNASIIRKIIVIAAAAALSVFAGISFYASRHLKEPLVLGPSVTKVMKLSDYFSGIKGSTNDINIYMLEGSKPGGTILIMAASHPEEPAGRLAAWIFAENAVLDQGRLIVIPTQNKSGSTSTRPGGAYPPDYKIPTAWGGQKFRMGDRWSNPLDQWPDPEVYFHYPSKQELAYVDSRNLNRCWPGRPNGTLTERTCYALIEMIRREKVDVAIDLHEAELQYPVISTIVAHQKGAELAAMASMMLTSGEGFNMGIEYSPKALRGLSHREIGDNTDAISLLFEAPEPFLDATRGRTDSEQLLTGKDEFVVRAGKRGLLFEKIDSKGWPIDIRVGRHTSALLQVIELWTQDHAERGVVVKGVPRYAEVIAKGTGAFLKDPSTADPKRVVYE